MLEVIITAIIISTIINLFFKNFHIPTIIGYISTWLILAYIFGQSDTANNDNLSTFAEFGIVFLMFTIGLEFSMQKLWKMKHKVFVIWWLQFILTSIFIYILSYYLLSIDMKASIIIACWLSLSSTAIVLKTLTETKEIRKVYWQQTLGILLFQDLAVIPILLLISLFVSSESSLSLLLLKTLWSWIILILFLIFCWKYLFNPFFEQVYKTKSNEVFIWAIFSIVLWASYIAHYLWFSYSLGALVAWILIAETQYKHQIEADLLPFRELLLGMFFITVWMQLDVFFIGANLHIIFPLLLWLLLFKSIIIYFVTIKWSNKETSMKTALSLFQVWEFWIVVFKIATTNNLLADNISQILIVTTILSMIMTPFILKHLYSLVDLIIKNKKFSMDEDVVEAEELSAEWKIVLIWYWRLWKIISKVLDKTKVQYMIVEKYPKVVEIWKKEWKNIVLWNASNKHLLKSLNITKAKSVIISVWNTDSLYSLCSAVRNEISVDKIIVKVNTFEEKEMLLKLNLWHIIVETEATALGMYGKL